MNRHLLDDAILERHAVAAEIDLFMCQYPDDEQVWVVVVDSEHGTQQLEITEESARRFAVALTTFLAS